MVVKRKKNRYNSFSYPNLILSILESTGGGRGLCFLYFLFFLSNFYIRKIPFPHSSSVPLGNVEQNYGNWKLFPMCAW